MPIGGLREKVLAAKRNGIKTIIIPKRNERDLKELTEDVRQGVDFHLVSEMDEVLRIAFPEDKTVLMSEAEYKAHLDREAQDVKTFMAIELLAPAGNREKLLTAFNFGADAAYMGMTNYSLRKNAGNFTAEELEDVRKIKERFGRKLYCTMNILFSEDQIRDVESFLPTLKDSPFDAFIITDMGLVDLFHKYLPDKELHLSTQASCINSSAAKLYHKLGFRRVILGREASLDDIKRIKDAVPELELEAFVHGAMCMSYSGRCMLSSFLTGRGANQGDCSHTCRWNYKLHYALEEEERKGMYFPIEEQDGYTTILSSKDLCMIDHLDDLAASGLSSLKIEGRMKSIYYIALVTRAYRKALDRDPDFSLYRDDLFNVSHREYSTGSRGSICSSVP